MKKHTTLTLLFCCFVTIVFAQTDKDMNTVTPGIFNRIAKSVSDFRPDTSAAPYDKITTKIIELRNLRGGFNINEALAFKMEEDFQKKEISKAELDKLSNFFKNADGKRWLDNATIWIYRQHFSYSELKQLVKFYKTSAGQKMAIDFPVIMIQSLKAAEMIKDIYSKQQTQVK